MEDKARVDAIRRIKTKREFAVHAAIYLVVNIGLVIVWAVTSADYFWPGWVIGGWGIGLVSHAVVVYVGPRPISEESIRNEMKKGSGH